MRLVRAGLLSLCVLCCTSGLAHAAAVFAIDGVANSAVSFDASTGDFLGTFALGDTGGRGYGLICMPDGQFLMTEEGFGRVQAYNGITGALLGTVAAGGHFNNPTGIVATPAGTFLVAMRDGGKIVEYQLDGTEVGVFSEDASLAPGPFSMAYGPNGNLYVAVGHGYGGAVVELDGISGDWLSSTPVAPGPRGLTFGPDGNLFVASVYASAVEEYAFVGAGLQLVRTFTDGLAGPHGVLTGEDGVLYVALADRLVRYRLADGTRLADYPGTTGGLRELLWSDGPGPCGPRRVSIDIKPGSFPNAVNPRSQGVIPVALLTTDNFTASSADAETIRFGSSGSEAAAVQGALSDVDGDGDLDLVLHFRLQDTGIVCGDTAAVLTGNSLAGAPFKGQDTIQTVGCK